MFAESAENFVDMLAVFRGIVRVDQNVVKIDRNADIKQVVEDIVHEALKSRGSISETKGHDHPFKQTIAGLECGLPLVTGGDADKMVRVAEVNLSVQTGFAWRIEEVEDERKWIVVLF